MRKLQSLDILSFINLFKKTSDLVLVNYGGNRISFKSEKTDVHFYFKVKYVNPIENGLVLSLYKITGDLKNFEDKLINDIQFDLPLEVLNKELKDFYSILHYDFDNISSILSHKKNTNIFTFNYLMRYKNVI